MATKNEHRLLEAFSVLRKIVRQDFNHSCELAEGGEEVSEEAKNAVDIRIVIHRTVPQHEVDLSEVTEAKHMAAAHITPDGVDVADELVRVGEDSLCRCLDQSLNVARLLVKADGNVGSIPRVKRSEVAVVELLGALDVLLDRSGGLSGCNHGNN